MVADVIPRGDDCPTGCGRKRKPGKLMCLTCWRHVPRHLQAAVYRTCRAYGFAARTAADDFAERQAAYSHAVDEALAAVP
jgi:hypothetical protein